jgi:hypothetical protein
MRVALRTAHSRATHNKHDSKETIVAVIAVHRTVSALDGRHQFEVRKLTLKPESFEVEYTITPQLPPSGPGMVFISIEATDDQGGRYADAGGAYGPSDDGMRTWGTISGQPGLPPEARELTLHFTFSQRAKTVAEHELVIQIDAASAE